MPPPVLSSFAAALYAGMRPMAWDDANQQYALASICGGFGEMFQIAEDLSRDQVVAGKTLPGWSQALDINRAPDEALPWLGQFVGVDVNIGMAAVDQRQQIRDVSGWKRGTRAALFGAPAPYLTGTKTVLFRERFPDAYSFEVITYTAETPNPAAVLAALLDQKPAGLVMTYNVFAGQDWQSVKNNYATWQDVKNHYITWDGVKADTPGI